MKNRFVKHKNSSFDFISFYVFIFCIFLFFFVLGKISHRSINEQKNNLVNVVRKDIVHCYAVEGKYPSTIDYLEEKYGLTYDHNLFYIDYLPIGSNIMPDYSVIYLGK